MYCKHPEEVCCNMTFYGGKIYCDNQNGFCHLHDPFPPYTNADKIRDMNDDELAKVLSNSCLGCIVKDCHLHNYASYDCEKKFLWWLQQPADSI